jgi:medium-chain acyl-[acyl-carrier-protein] hydrolase
MCDPWIQRPVRRSLAKALLICFPHAGGAAAAYRLWPTGLPEELELLAVQLPGRANRLHERALSSIPELVDALVSALLPHLDRPFAFFGHSMGAVLAFEVAHALRKIGGPLPKHLVVSGRRPPHLFVDEPPLHTMGDGDFIAEINRRYGGIPAEVLQHADLMALLLPGLRADVTALETHRPPGPKPLPCPITVFGGSEDRLAPRAHLDAWRATTNSTFRVRVFPGGHFYLEAYRTDVVADVAATLAPMLQEAVVQEAVGDV